MKIKTCHKCKLKTEDITPFSAKGKPECRSCYRDRTEKTYEIVRFYRDGRRPRRTGSGALTLIEAQAHCSDPKTRKEGVYFDGYQDIRR